MTMHEPTDALASPRFTGVRTFARLPHIPEIDGADAAVFGMPWDGGTSFRSGSRFGPEAIRSASALLRPYNPAVGVMVFGNLSVVDADLFLVPMANVADARADAPNGVRVIGVNNFTDALQAIENATTP